MMTEQLLTLDDFVNQIVEATEAAGVIVEKQEGFYLQILLHGHLQQLNLDHAYQTYQNAPEQLDAILTAHLTLLKQLPDFSTAHSEQEMAESLLPLLQQSQWLRRKNEEGTAIATRRFVTGLVITYTFDLPDYRIYLNESMLSEMAEDNEATGVAGVAIEDLHERALDNLRHQVKSQSYDKHGSYGETIITCETQEGYAAASILLPELMEEWDKQIPGHMLIGIPNRDFIIAFSDRNPTGIESIARQVQRDARSRNHPLSARLLVWDEGRIKELTPLH